MPELRICGLVKSFGEKTAVDSLSFDVSAGEIVGLLGPNGAGKSTTFLCLAGLLRPTSGTFTWDGCELGAERGQKIALIPETPDLYPMLTVWEHLIFIAKSCRLASGWQSRAQQFLARFALTEQRDTLGQALSKGMKQKTLIAATLLADAPVMLLDEPMVGLDPLGQRELRDILVDLRARGTAVVISTHMIEQAQAICDRIVILKAGRAVASGSFEQLRAQVGGERSADDIFLELTR